MKKEEKNVVNSANNNETQIIINSDKNEMVISSDKANTEVKILLNSVPNSQDGVVSSDTQKNIDSSSKGHTSSKHDESNINYSSPKKSDTLEGKLWKFKRDSSGVISEIRKREAYDKPSVKRKKKSKEARRRKKSFRYNNSFR